MDRGNIGRNSLAVLTLGAIGVVYGDIGTSPLYTIKEIFSPATGIPLSPENIVGAASTVFWALMLVVTLKYVLLILRADNDGEGGIMALLALASGAAGLSPRTRRWLLLAGVLGAALFYGDCVLTPAISVLSAVEGLEILAPGLETWVVPLSAGILLGLFLVQRRGTARVGAWFGPLIVLWFVMLAVSGGWYVAQSPQVLVALDPRHAIAFLAARGPGMLLAIGAVVLAITGAEALYADMGHFGRAPIRLAWTTLVLPALTINYFGQSALLLADPSALENPFYHLFPSALLVPAIVLATIATVIASQAVISGAYSMTHQAIQLGFLPRLRIVHTSAREAGQIYVPLVNWVLLVAVVLAVAGFGSSTALASAYGLAVTFTMLITTLLTWVVIRHVWRYPLWVALAATGCFVLLDTVLVASCAVKFLHGGWFPILVAILLVVVMTTWKRGRELLLRKIDSSDPPLADFVSHLEREPVPRCPRTAVFLVANPDVVPQALLHNLRHNQVLHQRNVVLTAQFLNVPWVSSPQRVKVDRLSGEFWRVTLTFGFMNSPDVLQSLTLCREQGLDIDIFATSFFLSRQTVVPSAGGDMAPWREELFAALSRNAGSVVGYFGIPSNSVIELGTRVNI